MAQAAPYKELHDFCKIVAESLIEPAAEATPNDLISPELHRKQQVEALATELSTQELVTLVIEGVKQLTQDPSQEAKQILESLIGGYKKLSEENLSLTVEDCLFFEKFLPVEPSLWQWLETTAMHQMMNGVFDKASPLFSVMAFYQNHNARSWYLLGFSLYQQAHYETAKRATEQAFILVTHPEHGLLQPEYALLLASCCQARGEDAEMEEYLHSAENAIRQHNLSLSPEWEEIRKQLHQQG
jgi:hypothetical protein